MRYYEDICTDCKKTTMCKSYYLDEIYTETFLCSDCFYNRYKNSMDGNGFIK